MSISSVLGELDTGCRCDVDTHLVMCEVCKNSIDLIRRQPEEKTANHVVTQRSHEEHTAQQKNTFRQHRIMSQCHEEKSSSYFSFILGIENEAQ